MRSFIRYIVIHFSTEKTNRNLSEILYLLSYSYSKNLRTYILYFRDFNPKQTRCIYRVDVFYNVY